MDCMFVVIVWILNISNASSSKEIDSSKEIIFPLEQSVMKTGQILVPKCSHMAVTLWELPVPKFTRASSVQ